MPNGTVPVAALAYVTPGAHHVAWLKPSWLKDGHLTFGLLLLLASLSDLQLVVTLLLELVSPALGKAALCITWWLFRTAGSKDNNSQAE